MTRPGRDQRHALSPAHRHRDKETAAVDPTDASSPIAILVAVHALCDGLENDPRWPSILQSVKSAVDAGDLGVAADTLRTFMRDTDMTGPAAPGVLGDEVIRQGVDVFVATLAQGRPQGPTPC
jgi:hypothetical protein